MGSIAAVRVEHRALQRRRGAQRRRRHSGRAPCAGPCRSRGGRWRTRPSRWRTACARDRRCRPSPRCRLGSKPARMNAIDAGGLSRREGEARHRRRHAPGEDLGQVVVGHGAAESAEAQVHATHHVAVGRRGTAHTARRRSSRQPRCRPCCIDGPGRRPAFPTRPLPAAAARRGAKSDAAWCGLVPNRLRQRNLAAVDRV